MDVIRKYMPVVDSISDKAEAAKRKRAAVEAAVACCRMITDLPASEYAEAVEWLKATTAAASSGLEKKAADVVARVESDFSGRKSDKAKVAYYTHKVLASDPVAAPGYAKCAAEAVFRIACQTTKVSAESCKARIEGALEGVLATAFAAK